MLSESRSIVPSDQADGVGLCRFPITCLGFQRARGLGIRDLLLYRCVLESETHGTLLNEEFSCELTGKCEDSVMFAF